MLWPVIPKVLAIYAIGSIVCQQLNLQNTASLFERYLAYFNCLNTRDLSYNKVSDEYKMCFPQILLILT